MKNSGATTQPVVRMLNAKAVMLLRCPANGCLVVCLQKVRQKNQEMKVLMDQMRNLLWDVNAMLTLRK